jgi:hypothetical protein
MIQVLRLMGMPDKVIAFDELPQDLLNGLEMQDESKMPRHWRDFIGSREKVTKIKPYIDPMTRQLVECDPVIQKGPFTWIVDWELNSNKERWQEISSYVRRNAPRDFRLLDKIEDMAKPFASNVSSEITLEPEEVVIIPLPKDVVKEPEASEVSIAKPSDSQAAVTVISGDEEPVTGNNTTATVTKVEGGSQVATPPEIVESKAVPAPNPEPPEPEKPKKPIKVKKGPVEDKECICGKMMHGKAGLQIHLKSKAHLAAIKAVAA